MIPDDFFTRYNINPLDFDRSGLKWNDMQMILDDYSSVRPELESVGRYIADNILKCEQIHSMNYRVKSDDHLIEKIIRKVISNPERKICPENYKEQITDLVGLRVLHLFKEDWIQIHSFISETWNFVEKPIAYIRHGDSKKICRYYEENNCSIEEHPYGYRSVHYLVESGPGKEKHTVEIQVRTIFEEAWGEIDHVIRYPYHLDDDMLVRLSSILNRLAANADELGTYMRFLKVKTEKREKEHLREINQKNTTIDILRNKIDQLSINNEEKQEINRTLKELEIQKKEVPVDMDFPWLDSFMESPLFKNITSQLGKFVESDNFESIKLTEKDFKMMEGARSELINIMNNPENLNQFLTDKHVQNLMLQMDPEQTEKK